MKMKPSHVIIILISALVLVLSWAGFEFYMNHCKVSENQLRQKVQEHLERRGLDASLNLTDTNCIYSSSFLLDRGFRDFVWVMNIQNPRTLNSYSENLLKQDPLSGSPMHVVSIAVAKPDVVSIKLEYARNELLGEVLHRKITCKDKDIISRLETAYRGFYVTTPDSPAESFWLYNDRTLFLVGFGWQIR